MHRSQAARGVHFRCRRLSRSKGGTRWERGNYCLLLREAKAGYLSNYQGKDDAFTLRSLTSRRAKELWYIEASYRYAEAYGGSADAEYDVRLMYEKDF